MSLNQEISSLQSLAEVRDAIDAIDDEVVRLLNRRARCAERVAELKSGEEKPVFYRPEREAQIHRRLMAQNTGPLANETISRLYKDIISACLALEMPMKVAYLGPEGTFTHAAARRQFGKSVDTVSVASLKEVFREVESGAAEYGVVPVENSSEGAVSHTLDLMHQSPLKICGEVVLRIHHNLIGHVGKTEDIKTVYAHQQALAQCRHWLDAHLPNVARMPVSSNAEAARMVQSRHDAVALASIEAADIYQLPVIERNIEDHPDNATRFLILGHQSTPASGDDKTTILFAIKNQPGGLFGLLAPLAESGIDMNRIESRPSRNHEWGYVFFVDINGHESSSEIKDALQLLEKNAAFFRVLGSYPKALQFESQTR